jgi:FkbM family methyltransferase
MKRVLSYFIWIVSKIIGRTNLEKLLIFSAKSINADLHVHGLLQIGAGTGIYLGNESEQFFIKNILKQQFKSKKCPVIFDVGANVGTYSLEIKRHIADAEIFAFEPVFETFLELEKNASDKAKLFNIGFGELKGKGLLYNTANSTISEITTTHKDILPEIFKNTNEIISIEFDIDTIDDFCYLNNIQNIDFLKIDVEGNELSILKGASKMLANNGIQIIQFEFNTHNVYARVFLRDFYLILKDFDFYRMKPNGLLALGNYAAKNEIFTAQNLIAVHKGFSPALSSKYLLLS